MLLLMRINYISAYDGFVIDQALVCTVRISPVPYFFVIRCLTVSDPPLFVPTSLSIQPQVTYTLQLVLSLVFAVFSVFFYCYTAVSALFFTWGGSLQHLFPRPPVTCAFFLLPALWRSFLWWA